MTWSPGPPAPLARPGWAVLARFAFAATLAAALLLLLWQTTDSAATNHPVAHAMAPETASQPAWGPSQAQWSGFYPTGWVTNLPLASGVIVSDGKGLKMDSAVYRTSLSGGLSWTPWNAIGLMVSSTLTTTGEVSVTGLSFPDSRDQNLVQFRIQSLDGITYTSPGYEIAVDTVAPNPPFGLQSSPSSWTNTNRFSETWSNPSDLSGIVGAYYRLNRPPLFPTDGTFVSTTTSLTGLQVPNEGEHTLYIWLVDRAGNVDHLKRNVDVDAFLFDQTAPTVNVLPQGPAGSGNWYTDTVTATFDPQDALSGISRWGWVLDYAIAGTSTTLSITGDLTHTLVVTATDRANNDAQPVTHTIQIDSSPPHLTYTVMPLTAATGWYLQRPVVTFDLTDTMSGPGLVLWQLDGLPPQPGATASITEDGNYTLTAYGQDRAGNRSSLAVISLPVDTQAPTTTLTITPPLAATGYYTALPTLLLSPLDQTSGVMTTWMRVNGGSWRETTALSLASNGHYLVDYLSIDQAGNLEISHTVAISVDAIAPSAPLSPTLQPDGWSAENRFDLQWQNPPETSGIDGAYVLIGAGPPGAGQGTFYPAIDPWAPTGLIIGLVTPAEGEWPLWLWLADQAGNVSPGAAIQVGSMRYDATPPQVSVLPSGPLGHGGWYTASIDVTLTISDSGSGPASLDHRLDSEPWQSSSTWPIMRPITEPGKHILDYAGQDVAGQQTGPFRTTLRLDPDPPDPPLMVEISPTLWTNVNQFDLQWRNPLDTSGVATAYLNLLAPSHSTDGQPLPASEQQASFQAAGEGSFDLRLWLQDVAGNVSLEQVAVISQAVRYDATPPVTRLIFPISPSDLGWFRRGIGVTLDSVDSLSGVEITTWQLDGQPPASGNWLFVQDDGIHLLTVSSRDGAGNVEAATTYTIAIDSLAPTARLSPMTAYSQDPTFSVSWSGTDAQPNDGSAVPSGVATYDVQVRQGDNGSWEPWLIDTDQLQATFSGARGQVYAFRVRALDAARHASAWADANGVNRVLIDPVGNGTFATHDWEDWETHSELDMSLFQEVDLFPGTFVAATRLGANTWQACADPGNLPNLVCGDAWSGIAQTITVPSLVDVAHPTLYLWYRIQTYDQATTNNPNWGVTCPFLDGPPFLVDTFDITAEVIGTGQVNLLHQEGNTLPQFTDPSPNPAIPFRDLGWQLATIDMTPYAGQTVRLEFANHNRLDKRLNTWTDVYGIRLRDRPRQVFLPMVHQGTDTVPEDPMVCYPLGPPASTATSPWEALSPSTPLR